MRAGLAVALVFPLLLPLAVLARKPAAVRVATGSISGVVKGVPRRGHVQPQAGVWVIAETEDLATRYAKIVVTDDQGRFLVPDLPKATYWVWARGYGLLDSARARATPGHVLEIRAPIAPNEASAAQVYPSIAWYAMLGIPEAKAFPIGAAATQQQWLEAIKTNGCIACHALGTAATRTVPRALGKFAASQDAWARRITSGQDMTEMRAVAGRADAQRLLAELAKWTDRVAEGALPAERPARPQGVERNLVLTLWDWSGPKDYVRDAAATDRRNPTVNAFGALYGATDESSDELPVLDPARNEVAEIAHPVLDPETPSSRDAPMAPSPYWGREPIWDSRALAHAATLDERGRVWFSARVRPARDPEYCGKGSTHPAAEALPLERSERQLSMLDPASGKFTLISTCFNTYELAFASDAHQTLWASSGPAPSEAIGWLDRKELEETGDAARAQGWTAFVLDTNGNGQRDDDDERVTAALFGVSVSPLDGSVWGASPGVPGKLVRVAPGADPVHTALTELYDVPAPGFGPRGGDVDSRGVVWVSLASGHLASFDRTKCKGPLNGPKATGAQCPEGWTLYPLPGPQFQNVEGTGSAESSAATWVDRFDTLGLGRDVPIATGNLNEALLAFVEGKFVVLRVPYPLGYYTKGMDGRIDDPRAGWKGRGLWTTVATRTPFHMEGGAGTRPKVVRFQLRPTPLAK